MLTAKRFAEYKFFTEKGDEKYHKPLFSMLLRYPPHTPVATGNQRFERNLKSAFQNYRKVKNMKKIICLLTLIVCTMLLLTGCSPQAPKDGDIQSEITEAVKELLPPQNKVDSVKVLEHNFDKDKGRDDVRVEVITNDGKIAYTRFFEAAYSYDAEDKQWSMKDLEEYDRDKVEQTPLTGVDQQDAISQLSGIEVVADNERWGIRENSVSLNIEAQETDLEAGTDSVTANVIIDDDVKQATGQLVMTFKFDKGWTLQSISGEDSFSTSVRPGRELNVPDEELAALIQELEYAGQSVTVTKGEVSGLVVTASGESDKGKVRTYEYNFVLTKPAATLHINATAEYNYIETGWTLGNTSAEAEITSVIALGGTWKGTIGGYYKGNLTLSISDTEQSGASSLSGILSYIPDRANPGSYNVAGTFDAYTLRLDLRAGDWIEEPILSTGALKNVNAVLDINTGELRGTACWNANFTANKSD